MSAKYFKPKSLTWWASVVPLGLGSFMAAEPIHGLIEYVDTVANATGMTAPMLINAGLMGIGIRGAVGNA